MTPATSQTAPALRAFMTGLVDYAGLFPPTKLPMKPSVENYARHIRGEDRWALGRFICPVSKLDEFRAAAAGLLPGPDDVEEVPLRSQANGHAGGGGAPPSPPEEDAFPGWRLSVLIDGDLEADLDAIARFNDHHSQPANGLALVDAIEVKVPASGAATFLDNAIEVVPDEVYPFFEIPAAAPEMRGLVIALAGAEAGAKVRCGGITPDAIPAIQAVADFIVACDAADVPFKATAGLHHPVRAEHNLTYEPGCPRATMHGFLNVFLAAALLKNRRITAKDVPAVLAEADPAAFRFAGDAASWRDRTLSAAEIAKVRHNFALSYGSCSFEEPMADLRALKML